MNDYDLAYAERRFSAAETMNRLQVTRLVDRLRRWTDLNSDGWPYWQKPRRAAGAAMVLIQSTTNAENERQEEVDATAVQVRIAVASIKRFLTQHDVSSEDRAYILGPFHPSQELS